MHVWISAVWLLFQMNQSDKKQNEKIKQTQYKQKNRRKKQIPDRWCAWYAVKQLTPLVVPDVFHGCLWVLQYVRR